MDSISTSVAEIHMDQEGIVHIHFPIKNVKMTVEDSRKIYEGRMQLANKDSKQLIIADLRTNPNPDRGAREFTKSTEMVNTTKTMALLVGGPISKMLGNFFIGFNKGDFPVRLFTEKEKAINWLKKYK